MSDESHVVPAIKTLATWKVWWDQSLACSIACSLYQSIDPRKLPRNGRLLESDVFRSEHFEDEHISSIAEGLLKSYPTDRQPSAYLLGDAVLHLDMKMKHSLLGKPHTNPCREKPEGMGL